MRRLALLLLLAAVAYAIELTGTWMGAFDEVGPDGAVKNGTAHLDLKLAGQTVTGTAGPDESHQMPISSGKLDGKKLTFDLVRPQGTMRFDLTFDGESIKGAVSADEQGQKRTARVDLKRKP
jgi:hypothetical protein